MPAERRTMPAKPLKTERTHEENQERAYIAASRRSDRSLEARIESARRASEIHKKRTGRALRVTEQDVVNEEMYEEEDDDIPSQYQRLSAHLHTSSMMFNRKLHDYIATQQGVRNMFMLQYQNQQLPFGNQFQQNTPQFPQTNNFVGQPMLSPQAFNSPQQMFTQPSQPYSPQGFQQQQQGYRQAPYSIPQRTQSHQRSASIATPQQLPNYASSAQSTGGAPATPGGDASRRMSLPPQAFEQSSYQTPDGQARPSLSRSTTSQSVQQQPVSPQPGQSDSTSTSPSAAGTPKSSSEHTASTSQPPWAPLNFSTSSQVLDMNPLSMSLAPEAQQLVGSAVDWNDPRTAIYMAGSDNLPQYYPTYTYNPNLSPKVSRAGNSGASSGMPQTLVPSETLKVDTAFDNANSMMPSSAMSDAMFSADSMFSSGFESGFFDHPSGVDMGQGSDQTYPEDFDTNQFLKLE